MESYSKPSADSKQIKHLTRSECIAKPVGALDSKSPFERENVTGATQAVFWVKLNKTNEAISVDAPPDGIDGNQLAVTSPETTFKSQDKPLVAEIPLPDSDIPIPVRVIEGATSVLEDKIAATKAVRAVLLVFRPVRADRFAMA